MQLFQQLFFEVADKFFDIFHRLRRRVHVLDQFGAVLLDLFVDLLLVELG